MGRASAARRAAWSPVLTICTTRGSSAARAPAATSTAHATLKTMAEVRDIEGLSELKTAVALAQAVDVNTELVGDVHPQVADMGARSRQDVPIARADAAADRHERQRIR